MQGLRDMLKEFDRVVGRRRLGSLHINDSATPIGSNRDRHAVLGQGEFGEKGCATVLSEPRFDKLPCVLETGTDSGSPSADDVALAFKLRKRGLTSRKRSAGAKRSNAPKKTAKR